MPSQCRQNNDRTIWPQESERHNAKVVSLCKMPPEGFRTKPSNTAEYGLLQINGAEDKLDEQLVRAAVSRTYVSWVVQL
jgi:hypothetical protein